MNYEEQCKEDLPCERFLRIGAENMTDSELLAILLRTGTAGSSVLDLSRKILSMGKYPRTGLLGLHDLTVEELTAIPGIGEVKAVRLKAVAELAVRMHRAEAKSGICIHEASTIADYFMEQMRHHDTERGILVSLDSKGQILAESLLSVGNVNLSLISPRTVFLEALKCHAVNVILLHNHPSGDPTPSRADRDLTHRLYKLSKMMEIPLLDHIIIGDQKYYSFQEHHALESDPGKRYAS
jgi:DNA repair protein RadC